MEQPSLVQSTARSSIGKEDTKDNALHQLSKFNSSRLHYQNADIMGITEVISPPKTQRGLEPGQMSDKGSRSRIIIEEVPGENDPAGPSAKNHAEQQQNGRVRQYPDVLGACPIH